MTNERQFLTEPAIEQLLITHLLYHCTEPFPSKIFLHSPALNRYLVAFQFGNCCRTLISQSSFWKHVLSIWKLHEEGEIMVGTKKHVDLINVNDVRIRFIENKNTYSPLHNTKSEITAFLKFKFSISARHILKH